MPTIYNVLFQLNDTSPDYGKIVVTRENVGTDERGYMRITDPSETVIKEYDDATPDFNVATADLEFKMDIPKDANGKFLEGTYRFQTREDVPASPGVFTDIMDTSQKFCPKSTTNPFNFEFAVKCLCAKATFTDKTDYGTFDTFARTITIKHPVITGVTTPADIVNTTDNDEDITLTHSNVNYTVDVSVVITWTIETDEVTVEERIQATNIYRIECTTDLCGIAKCIDNYFQDLVNKSKSYGAFTALPVRDLDRWNKISGYLAVYNVYKDCNNTDKMDEVFAKIKDLVPCTCDCEDSVDTTTPTPITSICT